MLLFCLLCFFKQNTAYELRISDWSSDVCSSDLTLHRMIGIRLLGFEQTFCDSATTERKRQKDRTGHPQSCRHNLPHAACCQSGIERWHRTGHPQSRDGMRRSEEHTSELQSLMRTSDAVSCFKIKTVNNTLRRQQINHKLTSLPNVRTRNTTKKHNHQQ